MKTLIQSSKTLLVVTSILCIGMTMHAMDWQMLIPTMDFDDTSPKSTYDPKKYPYTKETYDQLLEERLRGEKEYFDQSALRTKYSYFDTPDFDNEDIQAWCRYQEYVKHANTIQLAWLKQKARIKTEKERREQWAKDNQNCDYTKSFVELSTKKYAEKHYEILDEKAIQNVLTWVQDCEREYIDQDEDRQLWFQSIRNGCDAVLQALGANRFLTSNYEEYWEKIYTKNKKSINPILLVSLHGTFTNAEEAGKNTLSRNSQAIRQYGQWLADTHGKSVDFLIFQWSAANTETSREESGMKLAEVILKYMKEHNVTKPNDIILCSVTHSWGGAVMQYAAKKVFEETGIEFDLGIQTACPVPHVERTSGNVYHFKKLLQFYSNADLTQVIGSNMTWSKFYGRKLPIRTDNDHQVWNIRVLNDGKELNHINIKWIVMEQAPELLTLVQNNYYNQFDLDACIIPENKKNENKYSSILKKYEITGNILIGIRNKGQIDMNLNQEMFESKNQKAFKEIYEYNLKDKSSWFLNIIRIAPAEIQSMILTEDAWIKPQTLTTEPVYYEKESDKNPWYKWW